jgi:hypothetical protein
MSLRLSCFVTRLCASIPFFRMATGVALSSAVETRAFERVFSAERRAEIVLPELP